MKKLLLATVAVLSMTGAAQAGGWSVIGGVCFNPAGIAIPYVAALANPHCVGVIPPGGGGGGGSGGGSSGGGSSGGSSGGSGGGSHHQHAQGRGGSHSTFIKGMIIGCMAAAPVVMIAEGVTEHNKHRQLTPTEAGWWMSSCLPIIPFAILSQIYCPDNHATYKIAELAYKAARVDPELGTAGVWQDAYYEACHKGTVPHSLYSFLRRHHIQ